MSEPKAYGSASLVRFVGRSRTYWATDGSVAHRSVAVSRAMSAPEHEDGPAFFLKQALDEVGRARVDAELRVYQALEPRALGGVPRLVENGSRGGLPWFALTSVGKESLFSFLRRSTSQVPNALSGTFALRILAQVARVLRGLHEFGWAHGDVSPHNIVLGDEQVGVVDLGNARSLEAWGSTAWRWGEAAGTPGYIAPERIRRERWDGRADVYSLGCVAYELLVGRPVFEGSDAESVQRQHLFRQIPDVGEAIGIRRELWQLLKASLAKDPWRRLSDLAELIGAIEAEAFKDLQLSRPVFFESRLWGRATLGAKFDKELAAVHRGERRAVLLLGAEGVGLTRLVEEFTMMAERRGLVVSDERAPPPASGKRPVSRIVFLGELERQEDWIEARESFAERQSEGGALLLGSRKADPMKELRNPFGSDGEIWVVGPLGREPSRRICRDLFGGKVTDELVESVVRRSLGRPGRLVALCQDWREEGRFARTERGIWTVRPSMDDTPLDEVGPRGIHKRILSLRRRAFALRSSDPVLSVHCLESAFRDACSLPDERAQRIALRLGFRLILIFSKLAEHQSVWRTGGVLLELSSARFPLLEARCLRLMGLSYRITGRHRFALECLDQGLQCLNMLAPGPRLRQAIVMRERVSNRLDASWAYYAEHDAEMAYRVAREVLEAANEVGTPTQRATLHMQLANAIALRGRFRYARRAVWHERKALRIHDRAGTSPDARVAARFELGFMLLLGGEQECSEATQILEALSSERALWGSHILGARVATYLAIAYRRTRRLAECEAQARVVVEGALDCGHNGYLGVAHACLGWASYRRGRSDIALDELEAALRIWQRDRENEPSRLAEYPFQWLALVPLIALFEAEGLSERAVPWVGDLLHPTQAALPPSLDALLLQARHAGPLWSSQEWDTWGARFVQCAAVAGYV